MKKIFLSFFLGMITCIVYGQDYSIRNAGEEYTISSAGQAKDGHYLVNIIVSSKKKLKVSAENCAKAYAVHGVIFRGVSSVDGYGSHQPLIKDPTIENTKSKFFNDFFKNGEYKRYAAIVDGSLATMKNKQTKRHEVSATLIIDKESLLRYLESQGIAKGFSDLW